MTFRILNFILGYFQALNKLDHPNVVELYCTFQDFGTLYYQMEFIGTTTELIVEISTVIIIFVVGVLVVLVVVAVLMHW